MDKAKTQKLSSKQKYDFIWNCLFALLLIPTCFGIYFLSRESLLLNKTLTELNPSYNFPKTSDFLLCAPLLILFIGLKLVLETAFRHITPKILAKKYKNTTNEKMLMQGEIYRKKLAAHMFKGLYYISITIFGYFVLRQLNYCPKSLLGNGYLPNMFLPGYPQSFYHVKPKLFDIYYLICLSFSLSDLIWLLFIYERQNDFINMLLHHLCTVSLIAFSYITNFSNVGSIVLFFHNESDILVHVTRLLIQTDCPEFIKNTSGVLLTLNVIYARLYVFGDVLYTIYNYITWKWDANVIFLFLFLTFLYLMHLNWTILLLNKAYLLVIGEKLSDTVNFEKTLKEKAEKEKKRI